MHKLIKISLVAALPALWAAGCSDFLKGGELQNNPNNAPAGSATNQQLFQPIQVNIFSMQNSEVAWSVAQWMQSLYGNARQQVGIYDYSSINNGTWDSDFNSVYTGGGLIDIRNLQKQALATTPVVDHKFNGIALVMEGWLMGTAADWWGDLPYNQALNWSVYPTPILDPQQQVYDSVLSKLNQGITEMPLGGDGPGTTDLVYSGSVAKWTALAHTLRARFLLHMVLAGGATYAQVLAEANLGISSNAGDYLAWYKDGVQLSSNQWWQFMSANGGTGRAGDMIGDNTLVLQSLMLTANDPRFSDYFDSLTAATGYLSATRLTAGFRQPLVTYNENLLIKAEAEFQLGQTAAALADLQAEQAAWATAQPWHTARVVPPAGAANMNTIMTEKYILMFQNVEAWNDWKRTCIPTIVPVDNTNPVTGFTVPSRLLYGATEQQTNPHIPAVGTPPNGAFNWNDVYQGCTLN